MNSEQRGEYAELLLQHMKSGRPFNDNQRSMLYDLGTHPDHPDDEIEAVLRSAVKRNPPKYALTPQQDEGY